MTSVAIACSQTDKQRRAYFEARSYCDEHDGADFAKVMASMLYRGFMRDTEHLREIAARAAATFLAPVRYVRHSDGSLTPLEVPMRPELVELLRQTDEAIATVATRYGLEVNRQAGTVAVAA